MGTRKEVRFKPGFHQSTWLLWLRRDAGSRQFMLDARALLGSSELGGMEPHFCVLPKFAAGMCRRFPLSYA